MYAHAWAAGIIDGEGCITIPKPYNGHRYPSPLVKVTNTNYRMLERLYGIFPVGAINEGGKRRNDKNWKRCFNWEVRSREGLVMVLLSIEPHLVIKRKQLQLVARYLDLKLVLKRGQEDEELVEIGNKVRLLNKKGD